MTDREQDDAGAPTNQPSAGDFEVSEEEREEIEAERAERLDPENRPDNVEVDNTGRTFDAERGQFTDSPPDDSIGPYNPPGEDA